MRILVLQLKRIGDAILTAPALDRLRALWPEAVIEVVMHGPSVGLAPILPGLDRVHAWRSGREIASTVVAVARGGWDVVMDFTGTDRSFFLAGMSRGGFRFAYDRHCGKNAWRRRVAAHPVEASVRDLCTVDFHLAMVEACAGVVAGRPMPALPPPPHLVLPERGHCQERLPERYAVVHPGTARDEKYWLPEHWLAVARHLRGRHGLPVVLTGSGDAREAGYLESLRRAGDAVDVDLAGKLGLAESAAVIAGASVVATVDSAAMHLAGQAGRPQIALFGPTNPFHWAPRHAAARILWGDAGRVDPAALRPGEFSPRAMAAIPVAAVLEELDALLSGFPG